MDRCAEVQSREKQFVVGRRPSGDELAPAEEPAPESHARPAALAGDPADTISTPMPCSSESTDLDLASSGERAVFAWLEGDDEEPPTSQSDDTLRGMRISLDVWGRYGAATDDRTATRERRLHRLVRQYAAKEYAAALATAERMLRDDSQDSDALGFADACRYQLEAAHLKALGGRSAIIRLVATGRILKALEADDRTSLLVVLVRQRLPLSMILDRHGKRRLDVLLIVTRLVAAGVLAR